MGETLRTSRHEECPPCRSVTGSLPCGIRDRGPPRMRRQMADQAGADPPAGGVADRRRPRAWFIPGGRARAQVGLWVAACLAAILTIAVVLQVPALMSFDRAVTAWIRSWADPLGWPVDLAHAIGEWTGGLEASVTGGLVVLVLLGMRAWYAAAFLTFNVAVGALLTESLKRIVGRERPPGAEKYEHDMFESFPSGHTTAGIYMYLAIGLILLQYARQRESSAVRVAGCALSVFGPFLGLTRLVLGAHWPSDVLGGWAVGTTVLLGSSLIFWVGLNAWPSGLAPGEEDSQVADAGAVDGSSTAA